MKYLLEHKDDSNRGDGGTPLPSGTDGQGEGENQGTLILDAACAPVNIRYPQDVSRLNEAREKRETVICRSGRAYGLKLSRRYRRTARKDYLDFAKTKKHTRQEGSLQVAWLCAP